MVINCTNINKTNNHLSSKESLNSDGHQFHQYQQNQQSPLTLTSLACFVLTQKSISSSDFVLCQYTFIYHIYIRYQETVYVQYDICIE
jgi:hypothetical protein